MPTGTMSADPGWMKTTNARTMVTAWVWIILATLAWFAMAEEPCWDAGGALSDPPTLLSDSELRVEKRSGGGFLPVPVWKFLTVSDGVDSSDFDWPQFRCSNMSLYLRFSLSRHSDLRLRDGRSLLLLLDRCHGSVWTVGPWLLLELPYTSCHMALKVSNGKWFRQMELSFFDYLQQASMMTVISCEHPALSQCVATPAVSCNSTNVTVKLPLGARLQRIKALGKDAVLRTLTTTPEAVFVQIFTQSDTDYILEIIYLDSVGEMSTILATCTVKGSEQDRHRRGLGDLNVANYPYSPELSKLIKARDKTEIKETETSCSEDYTVIVETQATHSDSETINIPDGPDKSATPTCDEEKQDDLPCCEPLDNLPCCEPLDNLPCCNLSEEDLSCSDHEYEDSHSSQSTTGIHHGPFPGFSSSHYSLHSQSTSNDSHHEHHPNGSHPLSDQSKSISINVPFTGSSGKTSSGDPPFLGGQPTLDYGVPHIQGHGEGQHEDLSSKGGMGSHPEGSGEGRPSRGGEAIFLGSQLSSVQSQSLSSHLPVTGSNSKTSTGSQSTSDHEGHPAKGGKGLPSKGHGKGHHEGHPPKGGEDSHPGDKAEGHPSKGHGEGRGEGHPSNDGETHLPGSQLSVQSQPLSSHLPVTASNSKTSTVSQSTSDHGGHPSKGGKDSGEGHPSTGGEVSLPGSQPSSVQSQSLSSHVPVTGSSTKTLSGGSTFLGGQSKPDHGSHPSKGSEGRPSKGYDENRREGQPSKDGDDSPEGTGEAHPSKGHDEGHGEDQPSKAGETHFPGSQLSSVLSQSLSSHVPITGSNNQTSSGGQPTSDHGGHPSKGGRDSGQGHPSTGGEASFPDSQASSFPSQSLSSHVPVTGSSSKTSSGGQLISDHGGRPSKGGEGLPSKGHGKGHHEGHPSKGGEDRRSGGKAEAHPSKGHGGGRGEGHPSNGGETHLPGSQLSVQSQPLSSHLPVTVSNSKTSSRGQSTSDHGGHPSKGGKDSGEGHPSTGGEVSRPEGRGEGRPSTGGKASLPGSQPSSVQSQSLSSHVPVTGNSSKTSSGDSPFLGGQSRPGHGGHPSKGNEGRPFKGFDENRREGQPSKDGDDSPGGAGEAQPSRGHDEGHGEGRPSKAGETHFSGSQLSSVLSQSLSSHVPVTGSNNQTSSGGQPTSDHGDHLSKGGKDSGQGRPSKDGEVSRPEGSGDGQPSKVAEASLLGSQPSSVQSQSLSSQVPVTGSSSKTSGGQLTSDHGGRPSKGGEGLPSKGHGKGHHEGHPSKGGEDRRSWGKPEAHASKGHEGRGEGRPSKGGETHLPGSQLSSVLSVSLSSHVPITGSNSKISSGGQPTSDHGGHHAKGGKDSGEAHPSTGGEASLPGSQPPSVQSQSLNSHIPVTGSSSKTSSGGQLTSDHGGHPSKGGETHLSGSQLSSFQSQSLSSHVLGGPPFLGGQPTSDYGGRPSKGHEGRGEGHPSKAGETHLPGSQLSSVQSQSLSSHVPIAGSSSKTSSGGQPTSDQGGHSSKGGDDHLTKGHTKGHHEGHPSKGGKNSGEVRPSKSSEGSGQDRPPKGGETSLPGSQLSSVQSQSLNSHIPVTGSSSKTSSGGQLTSDQGGRPSKGHEGRGEGHPSKAGETHLPGSQLSSVQSQSLSSHVPIAGSSSKTSSGGPPFLHGQSTDHGVRASKGHSEGRHEGHPSTGGEGRLSKGHDRG